MRKEKLLYFSPSSNKWESSSNYKYRDQLLWILTIHCIPYRHLENSTFHFTLNISIYWTWGVFWNTLSLCHSIFPPYSNKRKSYLSPIKHSESPNFTLLSSCKTKESTEKAHTGVNFMFLRDFSLTRHYVLLKVIP